MIKFTVVCLFIITICVIAAQECQEGQTKTLDCNSCRCANGIWACTKKFCLRKREAVDVDFQVEERQKREVPGAEELAETPCAPNDYFQLDCNVCYCKTDRTGYLCTDNTCSDAHWALSTTTQIPLSNDSMLIMSNYGVELIENLNSNDNSISRIAKSVTSETLSHETVDPKVVDLETVESKTGVPETVTTETVNNETDEPEKVEPETVESEKAEPETVEPEKVESETVEPETVKPETVEPETVEHERVETQTDKAQISESASVQPTEHKSSPRNPLILANEQRRLASIRNQ